MRKNINILFTVSAAVCFIARLLQIFYTVDKRTGFFIGNMKTAGVLLSVFIFAVLLSLGIIAFFGMKEDKMQSGKQLYAVSSVLLGLAIIYDLFAFDITEFTLRVYYILMIIFGILAAISLFVDSYLCFIKNKNCSTVMFSTVIIFWIIKLIIIFTSYATVATVPGHVYEIAALLLTTLFMLCHGKYINGLATEKTARLSYASALTGAAVCIMLLTSLFSSADNEYNTFLVSNAVTVLYMLSAFCCYGNEKQE